MTTTKTFAEFTDMDELKRLVRETGEVQLSFDDRKLFEDASAAIKAEGLTVREYPLPGTGGVLYVT